MSSLLALQRDAKPKPGERSPSGFRRSRNVWCYGNGAGAQRDLSPVVLLSLLRACNVIFRSQSSSSAKQAQQNHPYAAIKS